MTSGLLFDIKKYSIHDGPGIRTTLFFKGCPLACAWCHNPESQAAGAEMVFRPPRCIACGACREACPHGAIAWNGGPVTDWTKCERCGACAEACYAEARERIGRLLTVAEALAEIERDRPFYEQSGGGVTFSGGEPLRQPEFLRALLHACRAEEIHTALDTCGFAAWSALEAVRAEVDLFLYDLKLIDDAQHRAFTGVSNAPILENLQALSQLGHQIIIRIPIIPGVNADDESQRQMGAFMAALPHLAGVELLPYHRIALDKYTRLGLPYALPDTQPPSPERMAELAQRLTRFGLNVKIGG